MLHGAMMCPQSIRADYALSAHLGWTGEESAGTGFTNVAPRLDTSAQTIGRLRHPHDIQYVSGAWYTAFQRIAPWTGWTERVSFVRDFPTAPWDVPLIPRVPRPAYN